MTDGRRVPYPLMAGAGLGACAERSLDSDLPPPSYDSLGFENLNTSRNSSNPNYNNVSKMKQLGDDSAGARPDQQEEQQLSPLPYPNLHFQHERQLNYSAARAPYPVQISHIRVPDHRSTLSDLPDASHPRFNLRSGAGSSGTTINRDRDDDDFNSNLCYLRRTQTTPEKLKIVVIICIFSIIILVIVTLLQQFA